MASNVCTVLEIRVELQQYEHSGSKSTNESMNILVVKGTAHTRLKEILVKATVIALPSFDVGHLKKSLQEDKEEEEER